MRLALLISAALLAAGCTMQVQPSPEVEKLMLQHSITLDAIVNYISDLQEKGVLPKPEQEKK